VPVFDVGPCLPPGTDGDGDVPYRAWPPRKITRDGERVHVPKGLRAQEGEGGTLAFALMMEMKKLDIA